jgi:hypothetical protein
MASSSIKRFMTLTPGQQGLKIWCSLNGVKQQLRVDLQLALEHQALQRLPGVDVTKPFSSSLTVRLNQFVIVLCNFFQANLIFAYRQGTLKGEVSLYRWPPVWPVWISLLQIKTKIVSCHRADSKPVKQEVNCTVILSPFSIPWYKARNLPLEKST